MYKYAEKTILERVALNEFHQIEDNATTDMAELT